MKLITYLVSGFMIVTGLAVLSLQISAFISADHASLISIVIGTGICVAALGWVGAGIQHLVKKDLKTTLQVIGIAGFLGWIISYLKISFYFIDTTIHFFPLIFLITSIVFWFWLTKSLQRTVARSYEKADLGPI